MIKPKLKIIVKPGAVELEALQAIEYYQFALKPDAAKILWWNRLHIVALCHPSSQVIASHRRENEQFGDFGILNQAMKLTITARRERGIRLK